jgi:hypothetical protein
MFVRIPRGIKSIPYGLNVLILVGRSFAGHLPPLRMIKGAGSKRHTARPAVYRESITSENGQTFPGCAVYC